MSVSVHVLTPPAPWQLRLPRNVFPPPKLPVSYFLQPVLTPPCEPTFQPGSLLINVLFLTQLQLFHGPEQLTIPNIVLSLFWDVPMSIATRFPAPQCASATRQGNPAASTWAMKVTFRALLHSAGSVTLFRHDCVTVLLQGGDCSPATSPVSVVEPVLAAHATVLGSDEATLRVLARPAVIQRVVMHYLPDV